MRFHSRIPRERPALACTQLGLLRELHGFKRRRICGIHEKNDKFTSNQTKKTRALSVNGASYEFGNYLFLLSKAFGGQLRVRE